MCFIHLRTFSWSKRYQNLWRLMELAFEWTGWIGSMRSGSQCPITRNWDIQPETRRSKLQKNLHFSRQTLEMNQNPHHNLSKQKTQSQKKIRESRVHEHTHLWRKILHMNWVNDCIQQRSCRLLSWVIIVQTSFFSYHNILVIIWTSSSYKVL